MKLFNILPASLVAGLAFLSAAAPTYGDSDVAPYESTNVTTAKCCDWGPTNNHHGFATMVVWIGRPAVNGGFLKGADMNKAVWNMLGHQCPSKRNYCNDNGGRCVDVQYVSKFSPFPVELGDSLFCMTVHAKWENEAFRQILINTVSATLMGLTDGAYTSPNCYEYPGSMM